MNFSYLLLIMLLCGCKNGNTNEKPCCHKPCQCQQPCQPCQPSGCQPCCPPPRPEPPRPEPRTSFPSFNCNGNNDRTCGCEES
ncbi:MAG: hypothetical protein RRX92_02375 [Lachnospiraceae bacterium]